MIKINEGGVALFAPEEQCTSASVTKKAVFVSQWRPASLPCERGWRTSLLWIEEFWQPKKLQARGQGLLPPPTPCLRLSLGDLSTLHTPQTPPPLYILTLQKKQQSGAAFFLPLPLVLPCLAWTSLENHPIFSQFMG